MYVYTHIHVYHLRLGSRANTVGPKKTKSYKSFSGDFGGCERNSVNHSMLLLLLYTMNLLTICIRFMIIISMITVNIITRRWLLLLLVIVIDVPGIIRIFIMMINFYISVCTL